MRSVGLQAWFSLVLLSGFLTVQSPADADEQVEPCFLIARLASGPSPYGEVSYQISELGDVAVACQVHSYVHAKAEETRCDLISISRLKRILEDLDGLGFSGDLEAGEAGALGGTWEILGAWGGKSASWTVHGPFLQEDGRGAEILKLIIGEVRQASGVEVFRDLFHPKEKLGFASFWTNPWSEVWVDGVNILERTPVLSLELEEGVHNLRLVRKDLGIDRSGRIRITGGKSTNFFFTVRPPSRDDQGEKQLEDRDSVPDGE